MHWLRLKVLEWSVGTSRPSCSRACISNKLSRSLSFVISSWIAQWMDILERHSQTLIKSQLARRSASECSHFRTLPSFWPDLAALKLSWWYLKRFLRWQVYTHPHKQALYGKHYHLRYAIAARAATGKDWDVNTTHGPVSRSASCCTSERLNESMI